MKKSLMFLSATLLLVACGPAPTETKPSASPSASAPAPAVSATPTPEKSVAPSTVPGTPAPIATPVADPNADIKLSAASATKNADFSYSFTLNGSGLGSLDSYQFLQVKMGPSTVPLVIDGASKVNNVSLRSLNIGAEKIDFTWVPDQGAPTSGDEIEVTFERKGDSAGRRSTKVRLTVK